MKTLYLLLFTVVTLGGFGEAAPLAAKLEERLPIALGDKPLLRRAPIPAYKTISLAPRATSHHFHQYKRVENHATGQHEAVKAILAKMHLDGLSLQSLCMMLRHPLLVFRNRRRTLLNKANGILSRSRSGNFKHERKRERTPLLPTVHFSLCETQKLPTLGEPL
jgi:hypothetical protein